VRPRALRPRIFRRRTVLSTVSNSTSASGCRPNRSRMASGIVTCPLDVIRGMTASCVRILLVILAHPTRPDQDRFQGVR
jgi:hypothetical protein